MFLNARLLTLFSAMRRMVPTRFGEDRSELTREEAILNAL
jgi:hypothetical protein